MVRLIPLGVALVAAALYFVGLGDAPFLDPPEGFHAEIAREMAARGDLVTLRLNGVRYLDKPPLLHWLMSAGFSVTGIAPHTARLWPALGGVSCAAVTAADSAFQILDRDESQRFHRPRLAAVGSARRQRQPP